MVISDNPWLNKTVEYEQTIDTSQLPELKWTSKVRTSKPPDNVKAYLSENESNPMQSNWFDS